MSLPPALAASPQLSSWLRISTDGTVVILPGKVELGQGIHTALAQLVAEELEIDVERVEVATVSTANSPNEGYTAGSLSVQQSGAALRQVAAEVRQMLVAAAQVRLNSSALTLRNGRLADDATGRSVGFGELATAVSLDRDASGDAPPQRRAGGSSRVSVRRLDLPAKLRGEPSYVHDLRFPGQLYGRVLRPPSRGAVLRCIDQSGFTRFPDLTLVVNGNFVGVIAQREDIALAALSEVRAAAVWDEVDTLPDEAELERTLRSSANHSEVVYSRDATDDLQDARVTTLRARYFRPHLAHGSIAPSAAVAQWDERGAGVHVWTHSQGVYPLRADLARALDLSESAVLVEHVEGAGCYGHNGADDAAYDAVLLARAVPGRPVHLTWSREDELGWAPLAPAMVVELEADLTPEQSVSRWRYASWGAGHSSRPFSLASPSFLGFAHQAGGQPIPPAVDPEFARGGGAARNAVPPYSVGSIEVTTHRLLDPPLRTSAMRALGAHLNVFATESLIDELAAVAGCDPLAFRLGLLEDERASAVLRAAGESSGWGTALPGDAVGRGIGFARYKNSGAWCAVVAEVEVETTVVVRRLTIAVDVGRVVNPDGVVNQIEGGAIQSTSWTIKEQVRFDRRRVLSDTWQSYPILNFTEIPAVDVVLLDRPDEPSLGAGEASIGPTAAAIGNAVYSALGVRVRQLPLSPANILAAIG